jgi:telomerase reverse transcriptase
MSYALRSSGAQRQRRGPIWSKTHPYVPPKLESRTLVEFLTFFIDVLNRYPDSNKILHTLHIMKYIFPRQFGLHNVFTSTVDSRESVQPFKDYTLREEEIAQTDDLKTKSKPGTRSGMDTDATKPNSKIPKRLRGKLVQLIQKLQKRHRLCAYSELLKHYCPPEVLPHLSFRGFCSISSRG